MKLENVQFLSQKTDGKRTVFNIQYDYNGDTYQIPIPLDMKTEVAPKEVEEDIRLAMNTRNPNNVMKLIEEYYGTSQNALYNKIQEYRITYNADKKVDKKPYDDRMPDPKTQYLSAFGWEYNKQQNVASLQVILRNKKTDEITTMLYKYPRGGFDPDLPPYLTLYDVRRDIYNLRDAGQHEKANEYFKKIFKKDPLTGRDID